MTSPQPLTGLAPPVRSIESVLASRWARMLIPSLSDLFFLAILVWLFMSSGSAGWQGLLSDADVGWHIRTGEYILDHHAVPRQDLYSFSKPGAPWFAWEWGTDVADAALHRAAGLKGVVLFAAVVLALFATTLIRRMISRGTHLFVAMVVALLGVGSASIHFLARPHILTLLFLSVSVWMIERDRRHPTRAIWWLVPLTVLWTNVHGGFLVLIAVLGLTAFGTAVEAYVGQLGKLRAGCQPAPDQLDGLSTRPQVINLPHIRYSVLTLACAAGSLINPYGYHLHAHVVEYLRSDWIRNVIQEFQSPSFRTENMAQFEVLLLTGLMVACVLLQKRRIVEALWIVFFAHLALSGARHVPVYVAVVAPLIACELSAWWTAATQGAKKSSLLGIVNDIAADSAAGFCRSSIWPAAVIVTLCFLRAPIPWPQDFPELLFPVKMIRGHGGQILNRKVLTTDQWGDYLIYKNPQQKVFVDGRSDFYGPEIGNQYIHLVNGNGDWSSTLDRYKFDAVLLPTELAIVQILKLQQDWLVEADDGKTILFVRRPPN